jgi:hypothetical protein
MCIGSANNPLVSHKRTARAVFQREARLDAVSGLVPGDHDNDSKTRRARDDGVGGLKEFQIAVSE